MDREMMDREDRPNETDEERAKREQTDRINDIEERLIVLEKQYRYEETLRMERD